MHFHFAFAKPHRNHERKNCIGDLHMNSAVPEMIYDRSADCYLVIDSQRDRECSLPPHSAPCGIGDSVGCARFFRGETWWKPGIGSVTSVPVGRPRASRRTMQIRISRAGIAGLVITAVAIAGLARSA